jgi:hypothetical protein
MRRDPRLFRARMKKKARMRKFFCLFKNLPIPRRDLISRPIAPLSSVAGGDDTTMSTTPPGQLCPIIHLIFFVQYYLWIILHFSSQHKNNANKVHNIQQHCFDFPVNLILWWDSNPGLLLLRQTIFCWTYVCPVLASFLFKKCINWSVFVSKWS